MRVQQHPKTRGGGGESERGRPPDYSSQHPLGHPSRATQGEPAHGLLGSVVLGPAPPRGFATFSDHRACAPAGCESGRGGWCRGMLGGSLGCRLLRGVGGSGGQFGARGVREGGVAMAAGESMAQRMVWVDLEVSAVRIRAWDPLAEPAPGERRAPGARGR